MVISIPEINNIASINEMASLSPNELIAESERYFCFQVEKVAKKVSSLSKKRIVMLAGPSSSGKTTTAFLLSKYLLKNGRGAKVISLDDFYRNQNEKIFFEDGTPDFETAKSLCEKLSQFVSIKKEKMPESSLLREFIGQEELHFESKK